MLPVFFNVTEECLKNLRQLELEAYSVLVSVLVAQGPLTPDKRRLLKDAGRILHVCVDRHKLEVRRAVNDDRLNAIAYHLCGPGISTEDWCHEGSRSLPLMQRIAPQTLRPILSRTNFEIESAPEKSECAKESAASSEASPSPGLASFEPNRAKKPLGKGQKVMIVPNSQSSSSSTTTSNSILQKTLSVPMTKVTKLNLDKFKIIPGGSPGLQVATIKSGKKIVPLSQLQILNHRFAPKGSFKVLPLKGKFIGKNVTMARITPIHDVKAVVPPLTVVSAKENKTAEEDDIGQNQKTEPVQEPDPKQPQDHDEAATNTNVECKKEVIEANDGSPKLMDIDTSELIESEIQTPTEPENESKQENCISFNV